MEQIELRNDFHGTRATVQVSGDYISAQQAARSARKLCPYKRGSRCLCSGPTGARGPQWDSRDRRIDLIDTGDGYRIERY